jgi:hypothetical protein
VLDVTVGSVGINVGSLGVEVGTLNVGAGSLDVGVDSFDAGVGPLDEEVALEQLLITTQAANRMSTIRQVVIGSRSSSIGSLSLSRHSTEHLFYQL